MTDSSRPADDVARASLAARLWRRLRVGGRRGRAARFVIAALAVALLLMWPFDFECWICENGAAWSPDGRGVVFAERGLLRSQEPTTALSERIAAGDELTVEAWVAPSTLAQKGPARIVSASEDRWFQNFVLGQEGAQMVFRVRTPHTGLNPYTGQIYVPDVFEPGRLTQVVATVKGRDRCFYVDGALRDCVRVAYFGFGNWSDDYPLTIGNERSGDRPWLGRITRAAIYDRALSAEQVATRFAAGDVHIAGQDLDNIEPLALYEFGEGEGELVHAAPSTPLAPDLVAPARFVNDDPHFSLERREFSDFLENVALYLPLGLLGFVLLDRGQARSGAPWPYSTLSVAAASVGLAVLSGGVFETLQVFVATRTASIWDLLSGALGASIGVALARRCAVAARNRRQAASR